MGITGFAREFHEQDRLGFRAKQSMFDDGAKRGICQREVDHRPIHQFDGGRSEANDLGRALHGFLKAGEVHDPEHAGFGKDGQMQVQATGYGQSAFAANQQLAEVQ